MATFFFTKLSTLGNNYLIINLLEQPKSNMDWSQLALKITDASTGILSDGIIILTPSDIADVKMMIYNKDGSRAKTCGNGLRLIGRYLMEIDRFNQDQILVETDANISTLTHDKDVITVDLGLAHMLTEPYEPLSLKSDVTKYCKEIETSFGIWMVDMISMGNPHFIIYTDEDHYTFYEEMGRLSKRYDVNVGMLTVINDHELKLTTYERGAGFTGACGTNTAAAVASAVVRRQVLPNEIIKVYLPGGILEVKWDLNDHLLASGKTTKVCCGTYFDED